MYFNAADRDGSPSPDMLRVIGHEFYTYTSSPDLISYGFRSVPTHTEDGIPIRKLYVSNLPPKTTRTELFGLFAQYGFIKSCWLKMGIKTNKSSPSFAFVTYSNPADAHKALLAPLHEKTLRGRYLRISPADSWHQPTEDSNGILHWKPRGHHRTDENSTPDNLNEDGTSTRDSPDENIIAGDESPESEEQIVPELDEERSINILDVLNMDCLTYILDFVSIRDLILSERVSKVWQNVIHQYLSNIRLFKTCWWPAAPVPLTTAVLRRVLQRLGGSLCRLHIDHMCSVLNDRTAHTIGKFCPHLEEIKVFGMHTKNWNPLIYGCKKLKRVSFIMCNKLTDSSLVQMMKSDSSVESLTVSNNTHVTGLFLTSLNNTKLNSLTFRHCFKLQGSLLCAVGNSLSNLTTLKLDVCPVTMWKVVPRIIEKLPNLQELSLSEFLFDEISIHGDNENESFCEAISTLTKLKKLNFTKNTKITNSVLQRVADSCPYLEYLNVSGCNSKLGTSNTGVGDAGVAAVCRGCTMLQVLDVSYLGALTDAGLQPARLLSRLRHVVARGVPGLTAAGVAPLLAACHALRELDACGCDGVAIEDTCLAANLSLEGHPRPLLLRLAGASPIMPENEIPFHKCLRVDILDDLSQQHMRPDFVDNIYDENSSLDSFDEVFHHDDFFDDDELFYSDMEEYEDFLDLAFNAPELIIL